MNGLLQAFLGLRLSASAARLPFALLLAMLALLDWDRPALAHPALAPQARSGQAVLAGPGPAGLEVSPPVAALAQPRIDFVVYARGRTLNPLGLSAAPGAGEVLAMVPADASVVIGGSLRYRAGLMPAEALWVLAPTVDGPERYGFLPAASVRVVAGAVQLLDLAGLPRAAWLAPGSGVAAVGGEGMAGQVRADGQAADGQGSEGRAAERQGAEEQGVEVARAPLVGGDGSGLLAKRSNPLAKILKAVSLPSASVAPPTPPDLGIAWMPDSVRRWSALIADAAARHSVDPQLVAIVVLVESGGWPAARSGAGARGLMQVMPTTASGIAASRGLDWAGPEALDQAETAIDFGSWYLGRQLAAFGKADDPDWQRSVSLAAAAYNGGPGTVLRHLAGAGLPAETQRYQAWVGGMWRERAAPRSASFESWWAAGGQRLVQAAEAAGD
jgi:hypothetical protein